MATAHAARDRHPEDGTVCGWPERTLAWDDLGEGALDLRYLLDAPAGRHGPIRVRDGQLRAADGTRQRFFGVNLVFGAAFPPESAAATLAERLARAGCNLVRVHHADSPHGPAYFDYAHPGPEGLPLETDAMARFDRLFAELKVRGVYVHLDLYTLRQFLPAEGVFGLRAGQKHVPMYAPRLLDVQEATVARLLTHRNPHTGLTYAEDPAVVAVQLINEQSMQWWTGPPPAPWLAELVGRWNAWLRQRYRTQAGLAAAWGEGGEGLGAGEDPAKATVALPELAAWHERYGAAGSARRRDGRQFLAGEQAAFARRGHDFVRGLGYGGPLNLSNLPNGIASLWAVAAADTGCDLAENNAYWDHPDGGFRPPVRHHRLPMVASDPLGSGRPFSRHVVAGLAAGRPLGLPFVVTECYQATANPWRAELPVWLAAYAGLQDWDGVLLFSYSHADVPTQAQRTQLAGSFDAWNDPAVWDVLPAAALLFHRGDVRPAVRLHLLDVEDPWAGADGLPGRADFAQGLVADAFRHRVAIAFGSEPADARMRAGALAPAVPTTLEADTGELRWDRDAGILRLDTPRTAGAVGFLGGRSVACGPVVIEPSAACGFAVVLVQSRDGADLVDSRHLLITAVARAANEGVVWDGDILMNEGHGPVHAEPVRGRLRLPWGEAQVLDGRPHVEVRR